MADVPLPTDPLADDVNVTGVQPVVDVDLAAYTTPLGIEDTTDTQIDPAQQVTHGSSYVDINLNSTGTTTVYDPASMAVVSGVHLLNAGSTAEVDLEVTNGTDTSVIQRGAAGESISFTDDLLLSSADLIQVTVRTAEGSALTATAHASHGEY